MKIPTIKLIAIVLFAIPLLLLTMFKAAPVTGAATPADAAADFKDKYKCAVCHTPTASKFFDPKKTDEEHLQVILNGKKGEKPPFMPAFKDKMTEDEAKAMAAYMKSLRPAS